MEPVEDSDMGMYARINHRQVAGVVDTESAVQSLQNHFAGQQHLPTNQSPSTSRKKQLNKTEKRWCKKYRLLVEFKNQHGHCRASRVSKRGKDKDRIELGNWVEGQRVSYRKGCLSEERLILLNDIGFEWQPLQYRNSESKLYWAKMYEVLVAFRKKHGHCRIRQVNDNMKAWLYRQRRSYELGRLREDYVTKLNNIEFEWALRKQDLKSKKQKLPAQKEASHLVPIDIGFDWKGKKQKLPTQKEASHLVPIAPINRKLLCHTNYTHVVEFKKRNGHCRVNKLVGGGHLGHQRHLYQEDGLNQDRINKLDDIELECQLGKACSVNHLRPCDNHLPQEHQQIVSAVAATVKPFVAMTTTPMPPNIKSQAFIKMDDDNIDSNVCEEFKETVPYGDSEYWV